MLSEENAKKIIHVDMDCFYAAIEILDNPSLANKPVAVGGSPDRRGVISTCNYIARKYGVRSAMATSLAYHHCRDLVVLPVNIDKYRQVAKRIHEVFFEFTDLVEPLSLDEAYLDVTHSSHCQGSATWIAQTIRKLIYEREKLTASAGVAPNKLLAKIASGWKKPNGLFVISPTEVSSFTMNLPVEHLYGVGKVTLNKLHYYGLKTCADLQKVPLTKIIDRFGRRGQLLYNYCRGIDERSVEPNKQRKSLSVEYTFSKDVPDISSCNPTILELFNRLNQKLLERAPKRAIKNQRIKLKFNDFKIVTCELASDVVNLESYLKLFNETYTRENKPIRLVGLGVQFKI